MSMIRKLLIVAIALSVLGLTAERTKAQDTLLAELYGQGVHAYFAGDYQQAYTLLSEAITQGSRDPRCFYFRGMTQVRMGNSAAAEDDLKKGARLEVTNDVQYYPIARSLERIQGSQRLRLERVRQDARLAARQTEVRRAQQRYGEQPENGGVAGGSRPAAGMPPPSAGADPTDPFAGGGAATPPAATKPAAPGPFQPEPAPAGGSPFEPMPTPTPAEEDIFGGGLDSAAPAEESPFGSETPPPPAPKAEEDMGDPFADPPGGAEPPGTEPMTPPAGDDADLFGDPFN
jgi:hypothetical protein